MNGTIRPSTAEGRPASDADDLVLFAQVVEAGSFSRAAERRGLPKSTVSRRIAALESSLGERLLVRTTRRLSLTEFGERVLEHARRLRDEVQDVTALAQHRQASPQGVLRASFPPDFFLDLGLVSFLLEFSARYPQVQLEFDLSARRVDLATERFDLAVRAAARLPDDATMVARRLTVLEHGLYASPAYLDRAGRPGEPDALLAHTGLRLMASGGDVQRWQLTRDSQHWEGMPSGPLAANSMGLLREMALNGVGIAALTSRSATGFVEQGRLERVLPGWCLPSMTLWGVTAGRRLLPTRTAAFLAMLEAALAAPAAADPSGARGQARGDEAAQAGPLRRARPERAGSSRAGTRG